MNLLVFLCTTIKQFTIPCTYAYVCTNLYTMWIVKLKVCKILQDPMYVENKLQYCCTYIIYIIRDYWAFGTVPVPYRTVACTVPTLEYHTLSELNHDQENP